MLPAWMYAAAMAAIESQPVAVSSSQSSLGGGLGPSVPLVAGNSEAMASTDFSTKLEDRQAAMSGSAVRTGSWSETELRTLVDVIALVSERKRSSEKFKTMSNVELYFDYIPALMAQRLGFVRTLEHVQESSKKRGRARKTSHNVYYKKAAEIRRWVSDYQAAINPDLAEDRYAQSDGPTDGGYSGDEGSDLDDRSERVVSQVHAKRTLTSLQVSEQLKPVISTKTNVLYRERQTSIAQYYLDKFPNKATGTGLDDEFDDVVESNKRVRGGSVPGLESAAEETENQARSVGSSSAGSAAGNKKTASGKLIEDMMKQSRENHAQSLKAAGEQTEKVLGELNSISQNLTGEVDDRKCSLIYSHSRLW